MKNVFLIVLDSVGIGAMPDSIAYGDQESNTLKSCFDTGVLYVPTLASLGLFHIEGVDNDAQHDNAPKASYARMAEKSKGKDTTIGHWEIAGVVSQNPLPTYPQGFPEEIIREFEALCGCKVLCNLPFSGTEVLEEFGESHVKSGDLIVYTSADSVFQIAAHEEVVPLETLYRYCEMARKMLQGVHAVGRVIARPFTGTVGSFKRTTNRHDYSLNPPSETILDLIAAQGQSTIGVGKIYDIFNGQGIGEFVRTADNEAGMDRAIEYAKKEFHGLCFVNLVDFDMHFGHRNDVLGYTKALNAFDKRLGDLLLTLGEDSLLLLTADHGCDPAAAGTDHSREYVPMLMYSKKNLVAKDLGTRSTFADIGATILDYLSVSNTLKAGESFLNI